VGLEACNGINNDFSFLSLTQQAEKSANQLATIMKGTKFSPEMEQNCENEL
jgi:hypothetical protein